MPFKPFDPDVEVRRTRQNLPHWRQKGVTYFVTSRLGDAMPSRIVKQWKREGEEWLKKHGITSTSEIPTLLPPKKREFHRIFTTKWHDWLDAGHGACWLKNCGISEIVAREFKRGQREKYHLDAWVLMPNHFHVLVEPIGEHSLSRVLQRWKGASARKANLALGRSGNFWQDEPFDHIVRSQAQLDHFRRYIAENPVKASLKPAHFILGWGDESGLTPGQMWERVAGTSVPDPVDVDDSEGESGEDVFEESHD